MTEPDIFLRLADVTRMTATGKSTIYRMIAEGKFPRQFRVPSVGARWWQSEVVAWMAAPAEWKPTSLTKQSQGTGGQVWTGTLSTKR